MVNIDKVKSLAKLKGLKLSRLCADFGEDPSYFDKVKKGLRRMDDNRIAYLADKLGTTFAYLTDVSDDPHPSRRKTPIFSYNRYNERRIAKNMTPNYVEDKIGVPHGFINNIANLGGDLTEGQITKMAVLLETTPEYLTGLTDDPRIPEDDRTGIKIGVFGDVAAGIPIQQIDNFDPEDPDSFEEINRQTAKGGKFFALRIKGDSMSPRILEGDIVIVRHQPSAESGNLAVVAVNKNFATCKKILWDEKGGLYLLSLNPAYPPMYFTANEVNRNVVTILGKVVEIRGVP